MPEFSKEQLSTFVETQGAHFAGLGGTFGAYRTCQEAFAKFLETSRAPMWAKFNFHITDEHYPIFEHGFNDIQARRIAMQLTIAEYQSRLKKVLIEVGA